MTLEELVHVMNQMYDVDVLSKTRKRNIVYARKTMVNLALNYGYQLCDITEKWGLPHDLQLNYKKTFSDVTPRDLHHYNACIDFFNLPLEKIPNVRAIDGNPFLDVLIDDITTLPVKDLKFFKKKIYDPFKKRLEFERKVMDSGLS